jgi:tRNA pseudouridine55 synthase
MMNSAHGILLLDKPVGQTAFSLVSLLRRLTRERTIGHTGTLDPFATGVMVMLIGKPYTRLSNQFLNQDKDYEATLLLGKTTDTYDCDGKIMSESDAVPSEDQIRAAIGKFQGKLLQTPPMFSAKKVAGKKLYELARRGIEIERQPVEVTLKTTFLIYNYPTLTIHVSCSKGTYIRTLAHDIGQLLGCGAHLTQLRRTRSGPFQIERCTPIHLLTEANIPSLLSKGAP